MRNKVLAVAAGMVALLAMLSAAFAQIQPPLPQFTTLYNFSGGDGYGPMAGVIQGNDKAIYGTTSLGGGGLGMGMGTVFRLDPATLSLTSVHTFNEFAVYGQVPYSGVALGHDGLLYGSTYNGGNGNLGTLYRVAPNGQNFATLYSFSGGADGASPDDLKLTQTSDGLFYGTTSTGGTNGGGTVFRLDPATQTLTTLYSFSAAAGVDPGLILGRDGNLYGTTYTGGANGGGSVFRFDPNTTTLTTLHDFTGTDGQNPVPGALIQGTDGNLYGTTQGPGYGTVYKLSLATGAIATLHTFSGGVLEGRMPLGGVTEGSDGYLYGTTVLGGQGYGTVYRVHPTAGTYNIVVQFGNANGRSPSGSLLRADDGSLYGVTRLGGAFNGGTVYRLSFPPPPDTTPPVITSITAMPNVLWRDNHKMVPVTLTVVVTDAVDPAPTCKISGVTSNQSITGDWVITGDLTVKLRAEHAGRAARVYTIAVQCSDAAGNTVPGSVNVTVPR
jgi:uncharacterized repeat protein (TIGR03803 family)